MTAHIPHWLAATPHVLFVLWPYVASVVALVAVQFGRHLSKELEKNVTLSETLRHNLTVTQDRLEGYRNDRTTQMGWEHAQEWEARYRLQLQKCAVEHIERPLPVRPLDAAQRAQLIKEADASGLFD